MRNIYVPPSIVPPIFDKNLIQSSRRDKAGGGRERESLAHSTLPSLDGDACLPRVPDRVGARRFCYGRVAF
jgi:hypothetical protein